MLELGTKAPEFNLPDPFGHHYALGDFEDAEALLIMFICNHCPFVIHVREAIAAFARDYSSKGLAVIAINSNDVEAYPDDSPEKMAAEIKIAGYSFPYLYDATQSVAKAFKAACTPDFFLFDQSRALAYRGQFDRSRPGTGVPATGHDMRLAADDVLAGRPVEIEQIPSLGCNIKWLPENTPDY